MYIIVLQVCEVHGERQVSATAWSIYSFYSV
uniref:Uncharacterized protein n=1 Tax=Anguilla anguilla TaxID=7936 RepID=A0A0E9U6T6_ANGAN